MIHIVEQQAPFSRILMEIPAELAYDKAGLEAYVRAEKRIAEADEVRLVKRSLDARGGKAKYLLQAEVGQFAPDTPITYPDVSQAEPVIIVGAGPAGLFAALRLIELGLRPIVLERGSDVRARRRDLAAINKVGIVNPESNYCFGEGGAGTYSDGKLYTRSKKRGSIYRILERFVANGADPDILIEAHPHIGTNKLPKVVASITETIRTHGGEVRFGAKVMSLDVGKNGIRAVKLAEETLEAQAVILATGHSARDVFYMLHEQGIAIHAKAFAIGVRVEHPQAFVNQRQYRQSRSEVLPPASYSLNAETYYQGRRVGVFSFCMCPGGFIVPAATANDELVVNGMSPSRRDSKFANSGMVAEVNEANYGTSDPLAGLRYQEHIERMALEASGGGQVAPSQMISSFTTGGFSDQTVDTSYQPGLAPSRFNTFLPAEIWEPLRAGFKAFDKRMTGFLHPEGQVIGVESRTSSPVRIPRETDSGQHPDVPGLFPCGEGAGYAGGILSAAMDGEHIAECVGQFIYGHTRASQAQVV